MPARSTERECGSAERRGCLPERGGTSSLDCNRRSRQERKPIIVITDDEQSYAGLAPPGEEIRFIPTNECCDPAYGCTADLILLDVDDRTGRGVDVLKKVKTAAPGVPVILIADAGSEGHAVTAFRLGARDYFRKPFQCCELRSTVKRLLLLKRKPERKRLPSSTEDKVFSPEPDTIAPRESGKMGHVVDYIRNNVSKDLSLERLAREACISNTTSAGCSAPA